MKAFFKPTFVRLFFFILLLLTSFVVAYFHFGLCANVPDTERNCDLSSRVVEFLLLPHHVYFWASSAYESYQVKQALETQEVIMTTVKNTSNTVIALWAVVWILAQCAWTYFLVCFFTSFKKKR